MTKKLIVTCDATQNHQWNTFLIEMNIISKDWAKSGLKLKLQSDGLDKLLKSATYVKDIHEKFD